MLHFLNKQFSLASFAVAGFLGKWLMKCIYSTLRVSYHGPNDLHGHILGVFHQQFFMVGPWGVGMGLTSYNNRSTFIMVSDHRDAEFLHNIIIQMGGRTVRGDGRRKPRSGLRQLIRESKYGHTVLFAVDGPIGPARSIKPGILMTARAAGAPVHMLFFASRRAWFFNKAWDRFFIPKPFSKAHIYASPSYATDSTLAIKEELEKFTKFVRDQENCFRSFCGYSI